MDGPTWAVETVSPPMRSRRGRGRATSPNPAKSSIAKCDTRNLSTFPWDGHYIYWMQLFWKTKEKLNRQSAQGSLEENVKIVRKEKEDMLYDPAVIIKITTNPKK
jgi:hypothetical protein